MSLTLKTWVRAAVLLGASVPFFVTSGFARDADGQYVVEGVGQIKCDAFVAYDPKTSREIGAIAAWFDGYLSAHNRLVNDAFDFTPWQTDQVAVTLLRQFCAANPDATVERSAAELIGFLSKDRLRAREDIISISNGSQAVLIYSSVREKVVQRLGDAGFTVEESDGGLSRALARYQGAVGLAVSGLPDQRTLIRLFRD